MITFFEKEKKIPLSSKLCNSQLILSPFEFLYIYILSDNFFETLSLPFFKKKRKISLSSKVCHGFSTDGSRRVILFAINGDRIEWQRLALIEMGDPVLSSTSFGISRSILGRDSREQSVAADTYINALFREPAWPAAVRGYCICVTSTRLNLHATREAMKYSRRRHARHATRSRTKRRLVSSHPPPPFSFSLAGHRVVYR